MLIECGKFYKNIHVILWLSEQFFGLQAAFGTIVSAKGGYKKAGTSSLKGVSARTFSTISVLWKLAKSFRKRTSEKCKIHHHWSRKYRTDLILKTLKKYSSCETIWRQSFNPPRRPGLCITVLFRALWAHVGEFGVTLYILFHFCLNHARFW